MQRIVSQVHLKRIFVPVLVFLTIAALFGGIVHVVLVAANVAEPATTIVYGLTDKRLWATIALVLALVAVVAGGWALLRPNRRFAAIVALVAGLVALVNGWLILVTATGGPNSGNGVVAGAMALVLALVGLVSAGLALVRSRRTA